ncbi:hypothetical protein [Kaistia algarum]|uniref:hypothetical protein n=1 Tax=Kaistia algarum TaxID=2083279 RepID=UPI0010574094|nr:hypothetical protein [Kaistia algarum]MCX5513601.1 hypothetical protein [Kaistia algarum]
MIHRMFVSLAFLVLLATSAFAACDGPVVALKKTTTQDHDSGILVSGDTVILRPKPDGWNALLLRQVVGSEIDVCFTIAARIDDDPRSSAGGIQFWRSGQSTSDDFYALEVDSGGNAAVLRYENEKWISIVKWGRAKSLKKGLNERNELRLTTSGDTAKLYINGKLYKTVERLPGGKGGYATALMAEANKAAAQFDFTNVRSPTQTDTPATPSADASPVTPADDAQKTAEAAKEVVPPLDVEGKRIYDLLMAVPLNPAYAALVRSDFVAATGNLAPSQRWQHGSAEVTYALKPLAGSTASRLSFLIYPDATEAAKYLAEKISGSNFFWDSPEGSVHHDTYDADAPFGHPIDYAFGIQALKRIGWTRWAYQDGRVVIIAFTDQTLEPLKEGVVTTDKVSDETLERGLNLLLAGKYQLDAIQDMKISTGTGPANGVTASLNAEMQAVYDRLLATPPDANNLAKLDTALIDVKGSLTPPTGHGTAEIVYALKSPADTVETSLSFYFFPDAAASGQYLSLENFDNSIFTELGTNKFGQGQIDPFPPFNEKLSYMVGEAEGEKRGWVRFPYQDDNVVIVAQTGEKKTSDAPYKVSAEAMRQGALLLALGKLQLDAARASKAAPASEAPSAAPAASGKAPLPSGPSSTQKVQ